MARKAPAARGKWLSSIAVFTLVLFALPWSASPAFDLLIVNLAIKSGHFVPEKVHVAGRQKFRLRITNHGSAVEEPESSDLNCENIVLPGATLEIYLGPLEPGSYGFFGDFRPDTARGRMIAKWAGAVMGSVLFIVWRESIEVVLVIGIRYAYLMRFAATRRNLAYLWSGVTACIGISALLAFATLGIQGELCRQQLQYFQTGMLFIAAILIAAILMTQMVLWMNRRGRTLKCALEADMDRALGSGRLVGVALIQLLAVAREGSETVLYVYSLGPDQREAEIRGIVEKDIGRWTYDFNPIFAKVLKGANANDGWDLQYAAAAVYRMNERYHPHLYCIVFRRFWSVKPFLTGDCAAEFDLAGA